MRQYDSLRGVTRRELNINYRSPLICQIAVPFSVSGSAMIACVPVFRHPGTPVVASTPECEVVLVSWQDVSAFGYTLARSTSAEGPWEIIMDLAPDLEFIDSVPTGTYFYRVIAVFADTGASEPRVSNAVEVNPC